jgi:hypothetical protein
MARGTLRRTGKARPGAPYVPPSANGNSNGSGSPPRPPVGPGRQRSTANVNP